jgi:hypothetical protein
MVIPMLIGIIPGMGIIVLLQIQASLMELVIGY